MRAHELNGRVQRQRCDALRDNEVPMVIEKTTETHGEAGHPRKLPGLQLCIALSVHCRQCILSHCWTSKFRCCGNFFCRILFNSHCYFYSFLQSFLGTFQRSQSFRYFHFQQRGKRLSAVPSTGCVCIWLGCKSQGEFLQKYNQTNLLTLLPCDCPGHDSSRKASRHSPHASFVTILTLEDYFILTNSLPSLFVLILFLTRLLFLFCVF